MRVRLTTACGDKQQCVLNAAATVFLAHGFSAATTDMIQREAGVSKATLYACFPGKEAMFAAVIEQQCARMGTAIGAIRMVPGNVGSTLRALGQAYLQIVLSPQGVALYRVVVAESPRFPELGRRFFLAGPRAATTMLVDLFGHAVQAGEIDVQAIGLEAAAAMFIAMLRSEIHQEVLMHPQSRPSAAQIDRWVTLAVTTFLRAFGTAQQSD